jgi:hypothetical protein
MKKWFIILFVYSLPLISFGQDNDSIPDEGKIPDRMKTYIQDKLGLSRKEADRFTPVFLRYFREFARTHRENKSDRLVLQQKIIELRLRYRGEFRQILDEKRANKVYFYEDEFRKQAIRIIRENKGERRGLRRTRFVQR